MATTINYKRGDTDNIAVHVEDGAGNDYDLTAATRARLTVQATISDWAPTTPYVLGDIVKPTKDNAFRYKCTVAGTSAATEPSPWTETPGDTESDGTVTWTVEDKNQFYVDTAVHGADGIALFSPSVEATDEVTAPGACTDNDDGNPGNPDGTYKYKITFVCGARGETEGGTTSGGVVVVTNKIALTAIPTGTAGIVTARKIYRTVDSGSQHKYVATIWDNSTTTYTDDVADGDLGANVPTVNDTQMDEGNYEYDAEVQWSGGTIKHTPIIGIFSLIADVTRN